MSPLNYLSEYFNVLIGKLVFLIVSGTGVVLVLVALIKIIKKPDKFVRFWNQFFSNF